MSTMWPRRHGSASSGNRVARKRTLDKDRYEELEARAHQALRSVNGRIEFLLAEAVSRRKGRDRHDDSAGKPPPKRQL